jgi:hypothetical protein
MQTTFCAVFFCLKNSAQQASDNIEGIEMWVTTKATLTGTPKLSSNMVHWQSRNKNNESNN